MGASFSGGRSDRFISTFVKGFLWAKPEDMAKIIYLAIYKGKNVVYAPGFRRLMMFTMKALPDWLFRRLSL